MGSTNVTFALVGLAIAVIGLFLGFLWGRSNVKSRVEDALEKERMSLSAREFGMRQQLEDAFVEIARLRPLAEELGRIQGGLKHERMKTELSSASKDAADEAMGDRESAREPQRSQLTPESADAAIKKLLQSLEKFNRPEESPATREESKPPQQAKMAPRPQQPVQNQVLKEPVRPQPVQNPALKGPVGPQSNEKKPSVTPSPEPRPQVDEWQEFARSLASLTNRKK